MQETRHWTNRHGTDSSTVPTRLAVIGGGGAGVEMASLVSESCPPQERSEPFRWPL
ncbi:hypothetical protein [Streptomyces sp. NPDC007205]|uniref:hypothetical protein n=1 Tax=Streptomyces sp. NPDC007205 TaxID=3154316 RepID=UPI0033DEA4E3